MAILLITDDKQGRIVKVEYVTDRPITEKGKTLFKQITSDLVNKPQTGLGGGYDSPTFQLNHLLLIKDRINASPHLSEAQKIEAIAQYDQFKLGDIIRYGYRNPTTGTLQSSDTYQPPIKKVIKFNDP